MKKGKIILAIVSIGIFLFTVNSIVDSSMQQNSRWGWFSAISNQNKWWVLEGYAEVNISGKRLSAKLFDPDGFFRVEINGHISQGKIIATAVRRQSDDPPRKMTGEIRHYADRISKPGRTSILLYQANDPGGFVVGITKD